MTGRNRAVFSRVSHARRSARYWTAHMLLPVACALLLCGSLHAATAVGRKTPASASTAPETVNVGVYLNDLYDFDIKQGSFVADFYIWFRWTGKDLHPEHFEVMNGEREDEGAPETQVIGDTNYMCFRVRAKCRSPLNFRDYPLDRQLLTIEIEDENNTINTLLYKVDTKNLAFSPKVHLAGWVSSETPSCGVALHDYHTNYGAPELAAQNDSTYSRFIVRIPIRHDGSELIYLKTFIGVFISVAIAFLTFLVDPLDLDPRFGVGVAGIFGAVSSMIVVSSSMPETAYFTMSDQIHLVSLGFIFLTILSSCIVLKVAKSGNVLLRKKLDRTIGITLGMAYVVVIMAISMGRHRHPAAVTAPGTAGGRAPIHALVQAVNSMAAHDVL